MSANGQASLSAGLPTEAWNGNSLADQVPPAGVVTEHVMLPAIPQCTATLDYSPQ